MQYRIHVSVTRLYLIRLNHNPEYRLCSAFTYQNASFLAQFLFHYGNRIFNCLIISGGSLVPDTDIFQYLGINRKRFGQFAERHFLLQHHFHHLSGK